MTTAIRCRMGMAPVIAACIAIVPTADAASLYRITDLGPLSTVWPGRSINDAGQIVGNAFTRGYVYDALGPMAGTVRAVPTVGGQRSTANAINGRGQVVGSSNLAGD